MKITIKDQEIELFYTYRMHILYENIVGESLITNFDSLVESKKSAALFYACILGSAKKQKINLDLSFDEFMDWLDENDDYVIVNKFLSFIYDKIQNKYEVLNKIEKEEDDLPKSTKKAKN